MHFAVAWMSISDGITGTSTASTPRVSSGNACGIDRGRRVDDHGSAFGRDSQSASFA